MKQKCVSKNVKFPKTYLYTRIEYGVFISLYFIIGKFDIENLQSMLESWKILLLTNKSHSLKLFIKFWVSTILFLICKHTFLHLVILPSNMFNYKSVLTIISRKNHVQEYFIDFLIQSTRRLLNKPLKYEKKKFENSLSTLKRDGQDNGVCN